MLQPTQYRCPLCPGNLRVDTEINKFSCDRCFINYKNNIKTLSILACQPPRIIRVSEEEDENQKAGTRSL